MIHRAGEMHIEHERYAARLAEPPISKANAVRFDKLRRGRLVGIASHGNSPGWSLPGINCFLATVDGGDMTAHERRLIRSQKQNGTERYRRPCRRNHVAPSRQARVITTTALSVSGPHL